MSLALIPDWQAQLRSRVYSGFYDTNWAVPLANALGIEGAQLDAAQIAMMSLLSIYPITNDPASAAYGVGRGVQLDRIGAIVGEPRASSDDATYRILIQAKILVNKSNGASPQMLAIALACFGGAGAPILTPGWVAQFTLTLAGVVMPPQAASAVVALIGQAVQAGVRCVVEYYLAPAGATLICGALNTAQGWGDLGNLTVGGALAGATQAN